MAYIGFGPLNTFSPVPSKDSFTGDGSTTTFDLQNEVVFGGENALEVFVDNVRQEPGTGKAYTLDLDGSLANKRITFSAAPANGASIYVINDKTSNTTIISPTDLNGVEFILDADQDTSITADTDDRIDFKLNGTDHIQLGTSSGDTTIKIATDAKDLQFLQADGRNILEINDAGYVALGNGATGSGQLRIYEDTDNGTNYSAFQVGTQSADITYTLPTADGTSGFQLTTNGSGVLSWAAAQIALANDGNNRIVTGTGSSSLNAEAGLTYDGSTLAVTGAVTVSTDVTIQDDLILDSDAAVLSFGEDNEITLTHVADTGLLLNTASVIQFRDSAINIGSPADGDLDINADDEIELNSTLVDINANVDISGTLTLGGNLIVGSATVTEAQLEILDGATVSTTELNKLDGATVTVTEINILDGDNNASSVTLADADRIIVNDNGTMKQVAVSALNTYTSASIAADDISTGDGAVNITTSSGNITIDAAANDSDIIFKGTDNNGDITMLTLDGSADGAAIFKSSIAAVSLDISGDVDVDGTLETDALSIASTAVTSTAAELNLLDDKDATHLAVPGKLAGTNFTNSLLIGHATTGTLNSADHNVGVGLTALDALTTADSNSAVGSQAGTLISTSPNNSLFGRAAGANMTTGVGNNTAIGYSALYGTNTGSHNIAIGSNSGDNITTGSGNVIIGDNVDAAAADSARTLKIAGYDGSTTTTWISGDSSGNLTFAGDVTVGDDLNLTTDSTVINFGADSDTTLTHTDGSGLTLNSTNKLMFNDASQFIQGASATVLDIAATDEIELTATLIEVVGNATVSGTLGVTGVTTSNAGVVVDNITIDGTEIDLSSGDLTVDVAGDIILDAGGGNIKVSVATTQILDIANSSSDVIIKPVVDAKDIIFQQRDGTSILEINDGAYARFTAAAVAPEATLTDASTVTWNALTQSVAKVTLGGNRTIGLASGGVTGAFISILVIQDGTGSRTVTWNAAYEFTGNEAPTLTTTVNLGDLFTFRYNGAKWLEVGRNLALVLS